MSARRRWLVITPEARADLNGIRLYTQQRWGIEQRRRYGAQLRQAMRSLLDHPELGPSRNDLYPGCRRLVVEQHVIYYRLRATRSSSAVCSIAARNLAAKSFHDVPDDCKEPLPRN